MEVFGAVFVAQMIQPLAQGFVCWWAYEEWLADGAEVETGAADEEWNTAAAFDLFDLVCSFASPFAGGVVDVRRDKIDQVMRDAFAFLEWDFRGGYLDLFIDLDRITVDDLAVEVQGDFDSESAFAGGSGTDDSDDWIHMRESITAQIRASSRRPPRS